MAQGDDDDRKSGGLSRRVTLKGAGAAIGVTAVGACRDDDGGGAAGTTTSGSLDSGFPAVIVGPHVCAIEAA